MYVKDEFAVTCEGAGFIQICRITKSFKKTVNAESNHFECQRECLYFVYNN